MGKINAKNVVKSILLLFIKKDSSLWKLLRNIYLSIFKEKFKKYYADIKIEKILIGQQNGMKSVEWIEKSGEMERISVLIKDSPYVKFLENIQSDETRLSDDHFLENTEYFKMAKRSIDTQGWFFEAKTDNEIKDFMKNFYYWYKNFDQADQEFKNSRLATDGHSKEGSPITLNKIFLSDYYEIVDGHHRIAIFYLKKVKSIKALIIGEEVTYLQKLILSCQQTHGDPELYQPIEKPEISNWRVVRHCQDRFKLMSEFLLNNFSTVSGLHLLDISCSYGWFLKEFKKEGVIVTGIDKDENAVKIGRIIYGLNKEEIKIAELVTYLGSSKEKFDIVLFLSIFHHFLLKKQNGDILFILNKLYEITGKVLFFDMGEKHEGWFKIKLSDWDDTNIQKFLEENTKFKKIIKIGEDDDNQGIFQGQYRRSLFVCVK